MFVHLLLHDLEEIFASSDEMKEINEFVRCQSMFSVAIGLFEDGFESLLVQFDIQEVGQKSSTFRFAQCIRLVEIDRLQMAQNPPRTKGVPDQRRESSFGSLLIVDQVSLSFARMNSDQMLKTFEPIFSRRRVVDHQM
jgi:hypothetical protein